MQGKKPVPKSPSTKAPKQVKFAAPHRAKPAPAPAPVETRDLFLLSLGERVRSLRARRGMTRRQLSQVSEVSERHLANLEGGVGNASALVLRQVASALGTQIAELIGDETTATPEWLLIRDLLRNRSEDELRRARLALSSLYGGSASDARQRRIALIGLRGAGKSTLGRMLAESMDAPFIELNREIERVAGCGLGEIHNLLGPNAYRRYERRALDEVVSQYPSAVIATPGGIVSDATTFNALLANCFTVWIKATPEEHMGRVVAQGDLRPMAGNAGGQEAMDDLKRILAGRAAFYGKADIAFDTSGKTLAVAFAELKGALEKAGVVT